MPTLDDLSHHITNFYVERTDNDFKRSHGIEEIVFKKWNDMVPDSSFGKLYVKDRAGIYKKFQDLRDWWEEQTDEWEYQIEEAIRRIIEGAKEDIAYADEEDERDPEDVGEDELDDEELWQWWGQEWHHNVQGRHWLSKHVNPDIDLQKVRYNGLEGEVIRVTVDKPRDEGYETLDSIEKILDDVDKTVDKPRIVKWIFGDVDEDEPLEW